MSDPTKSYPELQEEAAGAKPQARRREESIRRGVLAALGTPAHLLRVAVVPLWGDHFRVNVWTAGGGGAAIPVSYFVTADAGGSVLRSDPPIQRLY